MKPKAVILSGGPASVLDKDAPLAPKAIYEAGVPVLGICYGEQAMAAQLGGKVEGGHHREFGRAEVTVTGDTPLFEDVWRKGEKYPVWMSHGDRVTVLPQGFKVLGTSPNAPIAIIGDDKRKFYATEFHLEVVHTPHGAALLRNFVRKIAGLAGDWTMRAFKDEAIEKIRKQVGKGRVICGLSGGVNSAVAAVLIREQLATAHVRAGRSRTDAARQAQASPCSARGYNIPLVHVNASDTFLTALEGVDDPEVSARPSANCSSTCSNRGEENRRRRFCPRHALPDAIGGVLHRRTTSHHQSHHNVGGLPERVHMKLVEPLRELFKDEVRALGRELGLRRPLSAASGPRPCHPLSWCDHTRKTRYPATR